MNQDHVIQGLGKEQIGGLIGVALCNAVGTDSWERWERNGGGGVTGQQ